MTETTAPTGRSRKWRRRVAVIASPLAVTPGLALSAWDGMTMSSKSFAETLWEYLWMGLVFGYGLAAIAGAISLFLFLWLRLPSQAGVIVLVLTASSALAGAMTGGSVSGILPGVGFGLPTAIAYVLIAGSRWRRSCS